MFIHLKQNNYLTSLILRNLELVVKIDAVLFYFSTLLQTRISWTSL